MEAGKDIRTGTDKIAAIGRGTEKALKKHNLYPDLMPEVFDGASLEKKWQKNVSRERRYYWQERQSAIKK